MSRQARMYDGARPRAGEVGLAGERDGKSSRAGASVEIEIERAQDGVELGKVAGMEFDVEIGWTGERVCAELARH